MKTPGKFKILSILILTISQFCHSQTVIQSTLINESFTNNSRGWKTVSNKNLDISFGDRQYFINYDPTEGNFWQTVSLPEVVGNCMVSEQVEISFDLNIYDRNEQKYAGMGFIFDELQESFNLLYIGEEAGRLFSSIIPRRSGEFLTPIKDGKAVNFAMKNWYTIKIRKNLSTYQVLVDDKLILTFVHKEQIHFSRLYFTIGQYSITNFKVVKSEIVVDKEDFELHAKAFDPNSHKIYILLVGINNYPGTIFPPLNSSINDINSMRLFWQSARGGSVPNENIITLANQSATTDNILKYAAYLALKATGKDVLIIYLSGHGLPGYYVSYSDVRLQYSKLSTLLNLSKAKNKLMIVDACYAGSIKNSISPPGKGIFNPNELNTLYYFGVASAEENTNYLLSCDGGEISADGINANTNSAFTTGLLTILNSRTKESGQTVTLGEVYTALKAYFDKWNLQNVGQTYKGGKNQTGKPIPVVMNPQLLYKNKNNNLPLVITP